MNRPMKLAAMVLAALCLSGATALRLAAADDDAKQAAASSGKERFFEMRTYYAAEGKMPALDARFRDHTNRLFQKHGIDLVGYWHRADKPDVLVYILAYPSREAREQSWKDFNGDPEWQAVRKDSEINGPLVERFVNKIFRPTAFSPLQ